MRLPRRRAHRAVRQRHDRAGDRAAGAAHHGRSHHDAVLLRRHRALAAVERHQAGVRRRRAATRSTSTPRRSRRRSRRRPRPSCRCTATAIRATSMRSRRSPTTTTCKRDLRRGACVRRARTGRQRAEARRPVGAELPRHQGVQHLRRRRHRLPGREDQAAHRPAEELRLCRRGDRRRAGHQRQDERVQRGARPAAAQAHRSGARAARGDRRALPRAAGDVQGIRLPRAAAGEQAPTMPTFRSWSAPTIRFSRDELYERLRGQRHLRAPLLLSADLGLPDVPRRCLRRHRDNLPVASAASQQVLCLPIYPDLSPRASVDANRRDLIARH